MVPSSSEENLRVARRAFHVAETHFEPRAAQDKIIRSQLEKGV
jgi:hypothetical protein